MSTRTLVQILIQDENLALRDDANVTIEEKKSGKTIKVPYEKRLLRYVAAVEPGTYVLRVRRANAADEQRDVELKPGENTIYVSTAPEKTPFYRGVDGEKFFFRRDEKRLLLYARGGDSRKLQELLQQLDIAVLQSDDSRAAAAPRDARFSIAAPSEQAWIAARETLQRAGYDVRLAAVLDRGNGIIEGLPNDIVVRFRPEATDKHVQRIAAEFKLEIVERIAWMPNGYLLRAPGLPSYGVLDIISALQSLAEVQYAEPNVIVRIESDFVPNDFLYPEQTYDTLIQAAAGWDEIEAAIGPAQRGGSPSITVAIFDALGVAPDHPDLTGTLSDGTAKMVVDIDFSASPIANQTVAALGGDHGTQCASTAVGGFNDALGFAGLAGNCHLIGAHMPLDWTGLDLANAWMWAAGLPTSSSAAGFPAAVSRPADVISNSWGVGNSFTNTIKDALDALTTYGRTGRGTVVVFSIGNLGYTQFSAIRRYAAYIRTVAVGASINANPTSPCTSANPDPSGNTTGLTPVPDTRAYYSPYGPELDLVAPSHTSYASFTGVLVDPIPSAERVGVGAWIGQAATTTTMTAAAAIGATSISVASTAGFAGGARILIGNPGAAGRHFAQITGVTGSTISFTPALPAAETSGTSVSTGPNDYGRTFGGTSHACPTVAGAAALILSVRPEFTWIQVRDTLRRNTNRIDVGQTNAIGQWVDNDGDGVKEFSQWYGYGRLNLQQAIHDARTATDASDVVVRDNLGDTGAVPSAGTWWASPDLWVSSTDVPIPTIAYTTDPTIADPSLSNAVRGHDNFVFVRIKNVGTAPATTFFVRALIAHFAGIEFQYPHDWIPTNAPGSTPPVPLTPGSYLIGEQTASNLAVNEERILKFTWAQALIPPDTVTVGGATVHWHPCLLAEISPQDGPISASASAWPVQRSNNLAQRNITITGGDSDATAIVAGTADASGVETLVVDSSRFAAGSPVFAFVDDDRIMRSWVKLAKQGALQAAMPIADGESHCRCRIVDCRAGEPKAGCFGVFARLFHRRHDAPAAPRVTVGRYQNQEALVIESGGAVALPLLLAPGQYVLVAVGHGAAKRGSGSIHVGQRLGTGVLSGGYEIRR